MFFEQRCHLHKPLVLREGSRLCYLKKIIPFKIILLVQNIMETSMSQHDWSGIYRPNPSIPAEEVYLDDPVQLEILYDPLRLDIFNLLEEPLSIKEIAQRLGVSIKRLYHHVGLLEQHGFLRLVDHRSSGKNIERIYGIAAQRFRLAPSLENQAAGLAITEQLAHELNQAFKEADEGVFGPQIVRSVSHHQGKLSLRQAQEFNRRYVELAEAFFAPGRSEDENGVKYAYFAVLTPIDLPADSN
jgi:DNA-binding transcriptional ArsR family regulator